MKLIDKTIGLFTSLRLTVACLAMALVLVFFGTLAQVELGLYVAQERYFRSLFVFWTLPGTGFNLPVWPGGYLLGTVLLLNLVAAHIKRFTFSRKKIGIFLVHAGLILLLLGQFFTEVLSVESHMRLTEGRMKNYSESDRQTELVVIDRSHPENDRVVAIPASHVRPSETIQHGALPFTIDIKTYYPNSRLSTNGSSATHGEGRKYALSPAPPATKMDERNVPSAVVELRSENGSLGTWLMSNFLGPQSVTHNGKQYDLEMRWRRYYKPYYLQLLDFRHDLYKGTTIPKNFSSELRLIRPDTGEQREVLIYMNNPLRYGGETYYQGSFDPEDPRVSILQVVRNPAWLTPYLSVALVGLGLVIQFLSHLISFVKRRTA